jgi:hypothetical protein
LAAEFLAQSMSKEELQARSAAIKVEAEVIQHIATGQDGDEEGEVEVEVVRATNPRPSPRHHNPPHEQMLTVAAWCHPPCVCEHSKKLTMGPNDAGCVVWACPSLRPP